jgi:hypothetical protein
MAEMEDSRVRSELELAFQVQADLGSEGALVTVRLVLRIRIQLQPFPANFVLAHLVDIAALHTEFKAHSADYNGDRGCDLRGKRAGQPFQSLAVVLDGNGVNSATADTLYGTEVLRRSRDVLFCGIYQLRVPSFTRNAATYWGELDDRFLGNWLGE